MFYKKKLPIQCPIGCDTEDFRLEGVAGVLVCKECDWVYPFDGKGVFQQPHKRSVSKVTQPCGCSRCGR